MTLACMTPMGLALSEWKLSEEAQDSDPESGDGVEINLDDEPRSLLDFLNAWRKKVTTSSFRVIPELSRHIELQLLDLLTSSLDRELISSL